MGEVNKMINQETLKEFNSLYQKTYNDVLKYIVCKCSNIADAEDILQNVYVEVYKKLLKGEEISKSYLIGITKNKVKDYYRFRYKNKIISFFERDDNAFIDAIPSDVDIEKSMFLKYDTECVWKYLKKKKAIVAKIFYLYFHLELTIKEISTELEVTESNVKYYLYRTLKELNAYLESEGE